MAGPILIERGDLRGYEHFRQAAIARFENTTNPVDAERTLKISLLLPADPKLISSLEPFAELALNSFTQEKEDPIMTPWRYVSVSLMAYRQDYTPTAEDWCQKCLAYPRSNLARNATAHVIQAMACFKLHEFASANSELAQGRKMIEDASAGGLQAGNGGDGYWYDWLFARILLRQAEILSDNQPSAPK
jgi:hypothetical protein